mmetsp:Transcript_95362/g.240281  ORF Transcript_95362/g.240281 Transcript_95362/m.240281 type:complete len:291 (+) Transcript_95362:265-1137(+)
MYTAGGTAAGCAGCAGAGCEADGGAPVMAYVGAGGGDYAQEVTYKFVGCGQGEFDVVSERQTRPACLFIGGCVGFVLLFAVMVLLLIPTPTTTTTVLTTTLPYDCNAGLSNWQAGWSIAKKGWCCQNQKKGCPPPPTPPRPPAPPPKPPPTPPPPQPPTPQLPFDCNAGFANWQAGWSVPKKGWCCAHGGKGCTTPPPPPPPPPPTPSLPYDCNAGFANWQSGWSVQKKAWCCQNGGKGCPPDVSGCTSAPYDCEAGFANWKAGWSEPKKDWCCRHTGKGCTTTPCPTAR